MHVGWVIFWYWFILKYVFSGFVMKTFDSEKWNDSFPHTSCLSLRICCLICPKQSQEETTVLMPLKIWTLMLRVMLGKNKTWMLNVHLERRPILYVFIQKCSNENSAFPLWADKRQTLWFKDVLSDLNYIAFERRRPK